MSNARSGRRTQETLEVYDGEDEQANDGAACDEKKGSMRRPKERLLDKENLLVRGKERLKMLLHLL